MKKVLYIILIAFILVALTGCNNYKSGKFNEKLEFGEELTDEQITEVIKKVKEKWLSFSKVTVKAESKNELKEEYYNENITYEYTAYKNSLIHIDVEDKVDSYEDGIKIKKVEKSTRDIWNYKEGSKIMEKIARRSGTTYNQVYAYSVAEQAEVGKNAYLKALDMLQQLIANMNNMDVYEKNGSYIFISSAKNENYSGVAWGNETKEKHTLSQTQKIIVVNKDYEIEKMLSYAEQYTNQDPVTNEWYRKDKKISYTSIEVKVTYKETKENTELENELNTAYKKSLTE